MDRFIEALCNLGAFLKWAMLIAALICAITAAIHIRSWNEEYKTMGNVPCQEFIDVGVMIWIAVAFMARLREDDNEEKVVKLTKRALREHESEK